MKTSIIIHSICFFISATAQQSPYDCVCPSASQPAPPPPPPPCSCSFSAPSAYYPTSPYPPPPTYYAPPPPYSPPPAPAAYYPPPPLYYLPPPPVPAPYHTSPQTSPSYRSSSGTRERGTIDRTTSTTVTINKTEVFSEDYDVESSHSSVVSFYTTSKDSPKPNLGCILFDDLGCTTACDQVCRLYNCRSTGSCGPNNSCSCAITSVTSSRMRLTDYQNLSLDELWNMTFVESRSSALILQRVKKHSALSAKILLILRKPLRTGDDVRNRLIALYPDWNLLRDLKSVKKSPINRFVTESHRLMETELEKYVENSLLKSKRRFRFDYDRAAYVDKLTAILDSMNIDDLTHVMRQVREMRCDFSAEFVERYLRLHQLELDVDDYVVASETDPVFDTDRVDNIVAAAVNRQFVRLIRTHLQIEEHQEDCECAHSADAEVLENLHQRTQQLRVKKTLSKSEDLVEIRRVEKISKATGGDTPKGRNAGGASTGDSGDRGMG